MGSLEIPVLIVIFLSSDYFLCSCSPHAPDFPQGESLRVKSVPPVYTNEIKQVTLYEATIPIFFNIQLPKLPDTFPLDPSTNDGILHRYTCPGTEANPSSNTDETDAPLGLRDDEQNEFKDRNYFCALEKQFILASNHIIKDLKEQRTQLSQETKYFHENQTNVRKRRQAAPVIAVTSIVAGFLLRPAISKYTGNLFGTDEEWADHFNQMRDSLVNEHKLLLEFEESTHSFTEKISGTLSNITETLTDQRRDLIWTLHLLSTKMHADIIQNSVSSCKTKHLPSNLVPFDFLRRSLYKLAKKLEDTYNYTLAIDYADKELGKYYKLPIADCLFSKDRAHITLNVPLKRKDSSWKLFEIVHTKYAFQGQVCEVYPQEASYLAKEGSTDRTVLISNHMLKYCSIFEHQLCMIPQFSRDSVQSLRCTTAATLSPRTAMTIPLGYEQLIKSCSYRCYTSNELIITQVNPRKIVATNVEQLSYKCGTSSTEKTLHFGRLGALEIELDCNCVITLNGHEKLPTPFPCLPVSLGKAVSNRGPVFSFTMPISWSHNFTELDEEIESHEQMHHHVNHNWPWVIPVLNFSTEKRDEGNFTVPEKVAATYGSILTAVEVWLVILTVGIVFNFAFTIYCFFKLVMVRSRGYELPPMPAPRERTYDNEIREESRPKYHHSFIPKLTHNTYKDEDGVFEVEDDLEVKRRERRIDDATYQSNRNSVINKLI